MKMIKLFEAWSQVNEYSTKNRGKNFVVPLSQPQKPTGPLGRSGGGLHNYETIIWQYPKPSAELLKQGATGTPITQVPPQFFGGNGFPTVAREAGDNVSTTPMTAWVMEPGGESLRLAGQGEYEDYLKDPSSLDADSPYNKNTNEYDNIKKNKTNTKKTTAPIGVTPSLLTKIQMRLRDLGGSYAAALGTGGPGKDGVDGKFGPSTAAALNLALDALGTAVPSMKRKEIPLNLITGDDKEIINPVDQNEQPG